MLKPFELASEAKPDLRQIKWQETEFYALISYGLPVFTGKQYGDGFTPPAVFWPEDMDTDSWCETAKNAGMKAVAIGDATSYEKADIKLTTFKDLLLHF